MELQKNFFNFVNKLSNEELKGMCEARTNIQFEGGEFYTFPRNYKDDRCGVTVYDSEGQADFPISLQKLRALLIDEAECLLQMVRAQRENNYAG